MEEDDHLNELFTKALGSLSVFFDDLCKIEQATGKAECDESDGQQSDEE